MPAFWKTPAKPSQLEKLNMVTVSHCLKSIVPSVPENLSSVWCVYNSATPGLHLIPHSPAAGESNPGKQTLQKLAVCSRQGQRICETALCLAKLTTALSSMKQVSTSHREPRVSRVHEQNGLWSSGAVEQAECTSIMCNLLCPGIMSLSEWIAAFLISQASLMRRDSGPFATIPHVKDLLEPLPRSHRAGYFSSTHILEQTLHMV